jgi:hypothetical protein
MFPGAWDFAVKFLNRIHACLALSFIFSLSLHELYHCPSHVSGARRDRMYNKDATAEMGDGVLLV